MLRKEMENNSETGEKIRACLEQGQLLHDPSLIMALLRKGLSSVKGDHVILDGVPRDRDQALLVQNVLEDLNVKIEHVFLLEMPFQMAKKRIASRYQCGDCGACFSDQPSSCPECQGSISRRHDDTAEIMEKRLRVYGDTVEGLVDFYRHQDLLRIIDATRSVSRVSMDVVQFL